MNVSRHMTPTATTPEVTDNCLRSWPTPLDRVRYLSDQKVTHTGGELHFSLQDLETLEVHKFRFAKPLAYRFTVPHNMRRMGSTFTVDNSAWITEHVQAPQRTVSLDGAEHYVFSSSDGEFEVLAIGPPLYSVAKPPGRPKLRSQTRRSEAE